VGLPAAGFAGAGRVGPRAHDRAAGSGRLSLALSAAARPPLRQADWVRAWPIYPLLLLVVLLFVYPVAQILLLSFFDPAGQPTLANYARIGNSPVYFRTLLITFQIAGWSTLFAVLAGYPVAYLLANTGARTRGTLALLVLMPFWTSFLVRTYAWMFLLRDTGLINTALQAVGIIHDPLPLLYNNGAVLLGLVYGYLPFMVLPIYATLERLDPALIEAAADLGARPVTTVFRVIVPLSRPGIVAGSVLVFIPCLGAYLTPDLLGGGRTVLVGNLVQNQFTTARDWPFGSAVSIVLMALVTVLLWVLLRRETEPLV
jgi:spermidine/putrescine transport system permease protein